MPDATDRPEKDTWNFGGGICLVVFGVGLTAFVTGNYIWGGGLIAASLVGIVYVTLHLTGKRFRLRSWIAQAVSLSMLVLTLGVIGYDLYTRPRRLSNQAVTISALTQPVVINATPPAVSADGAPSHTSSVTLAATGDANAGGQMRADADIAMIRTLQMRVATLETDLHTAGQTHQAEQEQNSALQAQLTAALQATRKIARWTLLTDFVKKLELNANDYKKSADQALWQMANCGPVRTQALTDTCAEYPLGGPSDPVVTDYLQGLDVKSVMGHTINPSDTCGYDMNDQYTEEDAILGGSAYKQRYRKMRANHDCIERRFREVQAAAEQETFDDHQYLLKYGLLSSGRK